MKNHNILSLALSSLFVISAAFVTAQDSGPPAPPNVLVIQREYLKPGKSGAIHVKSEANFIKASNDAKWPTHYIAMGFDDDLSIAAHKAVSEMVAFLVAKKGMSRDDAYMLTSVAGDVDVTEVVDRNKGVHVMMPKAIFAK